jgi:hypothetical protein
MDRLARVRHDPHQNRFQDRRICVLDTAMRMTTAKAGGARQQAQEMVDRTSQCASVLSDVSNTLNDNSFYASLLEQVRVSYTSTNGKNVITAECLATTWNTGIEAAKKTLRSTTQ